MSSEKLERKEEESNHEEVEIIVTNVMNDENHRHMIDNEVPWGMSYNEADYNSETVFREDEKLQLTSCVPDVCLDEPDFHGEKNCLRCVRFSECELSSEKVSSNFSNGLFFVKMVVTPTTTLQTQPPTGGQW